VTNSVSINAPVSGTVGAPLFITGSVTPAADTVSVQLAQQNTTLPTGAWVSAAPASGNFGGTLTPPAPGTWYAWAYDQVTGASAVSSAISVPNPATAYVPLSIQQVADLLGTGAAGETPDELQTAAAATDADTAMVAQSGKTLFGQPFSAIWTWIQSHLPGYLMPQVTYAVAGTVPLDSSAHNQRIVLITAAGVTIQPLLSSLSNGFACDVINASSSTVALSGITTTTGASIIASGGIARLLTATPPGGALTVYAKL
jgi:hypothetical protein